jgi:protein Mpv17
MLFKTLSLYERLVVRAPIRTAIGTCLITATGGDYISQRLSGKDYDWKRSARYMVLSTMMAPQVLTWYRFINRRFDTTWKRLFADQLVFSPYDLIFCFSVNTILIGGNHIDLKNKIIKDFSGTYCGNIMFWGTALSINFKYVPLNYRLLYSNVCSFFFNIYLSYKVNL